ncbi:hypothetical protein ACUXV3_10035 [Roseobacteraceae bacterium NS-SX3]
MPLVAAADFDDLPTEPIARWLQLRDLLEQRLDDSQEYPKGIPTRRVLEYVQVISATAEELGIGNLQSISPGNIHEEIDQFRAEVAAVAARLCMKQKHAIEDGYLGLSQTVRERLHEQVDILRTLVRSSNFDEAKKANLHSLLDKLAEEVERDKLNYSNIMQVLAMCAVGLAGTTSFLADAPTAIATITQLIGLQKKADDEKRELLRLPDEPAIPQLPSPPKQLPAPQGS